MYLVKKFHKITSQCFDTIGKTTPVYICTQMQYQLLAFGFVNLIK